MWSDGDGEPAAADWCPAGSCTGLARYCACYLLQLMYYTTYGAGTKPMLAHCEHACNPSDGQPSRSSSLYACLYKESRMKKYWGVEGNGKGATRCRRCGGDAVWYEAFGWRSLLVKACTSYYCKPPKGILTQRKGLVESHRVQKEKRRDGVCVSCH